MMFSRIESTYICTGVACLERWLMTQAQEAVQQKAMLRKERAAEPAFFRRHLGSERIADNKAAAAAVAAAPAAAAAPLGKGTLLNFFSKP